MGPAVGQSPHRSKSGKIYGTDSLITRWSYWTGELNDLNLFESFELFESVEPFKSVESYNHFS